MRKIALFLKMMLVIACVGWSAGAYGQGVFTSAATGNWNAAGSWTLSSGTDADGIPDADDNVTITTHNITVPTGVTVACNNITVNNAAQRVLMQGAGSILEIYGTLNAAATPTLETLIDCLADATAKVVFKRTTNGALFGTTWTGLGTAARYEIDLPSNVTGTASTTVKAREITITSGTFDLGTQELRPDNGSANGGILTIQNGAILKCARVSRTGTANTAFASFTINGTGMAVFSATATMFPSATTVLSFSSNSTIEFTGTATAATIVDVSYPGNLILSGGAGSRTWTLTANRTVGGNISVVGNAIFQVGGAQLTVSGNVTVDEGAQIGCSNNSGLIVAAAAGTQTFTLNGICRVASNSTQTPFPTGGFNRQFNFDAYVIGANSIVSFRNPTTTASVSLNIDQPTGVSFANVEFYNIQIAAFTTTFFMRQNIVVTGSVAFPRIGSGQPIVFEMDGKTLTVGGQILNSLGTIGSNVGNTNTGGGTRTYTMSGTIELNGTAAQTTLGGTDLPGTFTNLIINNAAGVTLTGSSVINGALTLTAGTLATGAHTLTLGGTTSGSGFINTGASGTLTYGGTVAQTLAASNLTSGAVNNLIINNAAGVTTNNAITVGGTTTIAAGSTLSMGATLTANGVVTVNGTFRLNSGGFASGTGAWNYGSNGTLAFNTDYGVENNHVYWPTTNRPVNVSVLQGVVTLNSGANRTVSGTTTIATGSTLSMGATLTANGPVTVNGTFRLNSGGWATGDGAWNYGSNGTLAFNNASGSYIVNSTDVFWPTSGGPVNVNLIGAGGITMNAARAINGTLSVSAPITTASNITVNGTCQINNSSATMSNALAYGAASTLVYNVTGIMGRGNEWNNSPSNVTLQATTILNYPNGWGAISRSLTGNLNINSGAALYMDYGSPGTGVGILSVAGNVVLNGDLSLGNAVGGDLYVGGNWSKTTGTFAPNGREVRFTGTTHQSINNAAGETFAFLTIANAPGSVVTLNDNVTVTNDLRINAASALTLAAAKSLNVTGNLTIRSTSGGTGTFISNGTTTVTGTTTAEQHLAHTRNWYVSSPLSAAVVPASGYTIYRRNEAGATWLPAVTNPSTFAAGVGYIALPVSAASTLSFSGGTLNSGNVEVALTNSGTSAKGFNLVGNPYPAHLTWTKAFTDANEALIQPTIWYRTNAGTVNNSGQWSFQTFNAFSGAAVPETTTGVIPPMQAFWVNAIAPGTLTFNNLLTRSHQSNNPLKAPAVAQNTNQQLRLELTNGTASDELLIYFHEQAQNIFDRYDSPKFADANASVQLYSSVGNNQLVINGMSSEFSNTEVYLGFRTTAAGSYQLRPFSIQHFDPAVRILLCDNLLNTETDITGGESYAFNTTETTSDSRFSLLFRAPGATTDAPSATLANLSVYGSNGRIVVEGARMAENKARILLYNQTGQLLKEMQATGNRTEMGNRFVQGVYLVVVEAEGRKTTHKLIMK